MGNEMKIEIGDRVRFSRVYISSVGGFAPKSWAGARGTVIGIIPSQQIAEIKWDDMKVIWLTDYPFVKVSISKLVRHLPVVPS